MTVVGDASPAPAVSTQVGTPAPRGQGTRHWLAGLGGSTIASLFLGGAGWVLVLLLAAGYLRVSILRQTTAEGYLDDVGFGYVIVAGLAVLFLNGLVGIICALIGTARAKQPSGRWWSLYAILLHVSPWLLFAMLIKVGAAIHS